MRLLALNTACAVAILSLAVPSFAEAPAAPSAESQPAAPPPAEQTASGQQAPANDPDKIVCKKVEGETGTRLSRRSSECRTQREWDQIAEDAKKAVDDAQSRGGLTGGAASGM